MMATVFNALHGINEYGEEITYRMKGAISVKGYPEVTLQNMFAPTDDGPAGRVSGSAFAWATVSAESTTIRMTFLQFKASSWISNW